MALKIPYQDYTNLTYHGVKAMGRNFYLEGKDDLRLGCWHILPHDVAARHQNSVLSDKQMEQELRNLDNPVVIYFHGNSFDRTESSRCGLYNLLARTGFHVLALDYRGYGDSNGWPSEEGLIEDAVEMFIYAKRLSLSTNIFLWGHSMGTAIATALARELSERGLPPAGLILESPFNNLHDVVTYHPYSVPFRWLPWFEKMVLGSLSKSGLDMSTDERITRVDCPILILHAEDDHIIPLKLARKLYKCAHAAYRDVAFKKFDASRKFHHKFIYLADELPGMLT
ncbi:unnamed protein product [Onchocerca flexuosa]|uniref:Hydrolase, alpha/beta domain protein n=1 Tax=Onchocerca flexuosa TaxID=387005 RepID=A0A183I0L9_9BILA|nr:unnamed protein product [Onchocerca flexuosa]